MLGRHPRLLRAIAPASYVLVAVTLAVISSEPRFHTPWAITLALGLSGCGVLTVRRRFPLAALAGALLLALASLAVGTGAEALLVVITLFGVGAQLRSVVAWASFVGAAIFGALGAWVFTTRLASGPSLWGSPPLTPRDAMTDWIVAYIAVFAVLLVTTLLGTSAGQRRRYVTALVDRAERLARERDQQAEIASARERERIAREMHDVIAHSLSVMIAIADGAHAATDERPDEAKTAMALVGDTGRRTLGEVRRLLGAVRRDSEPSVGAHAPQPGASDLPALIEGFAAAGLPIRVSVTGSPTTDHAVGLTVYRIVQESLTNVLRHARGVASVSVDLAWTDSDVTVVVEDAAAAVAGREDQRSGRGILGMRERISMFGGSVAAGPRPGGGWRVAAHLQWGDK